MTSNNASIEQAIENHQGGDLNGAAEICRSLLKDNPEDAEALHLLGVILNDTGLHDQAVGFLEKALAVGGPNSSILHNYGVALQGQGKFRLAARAFRHTAEAAPLRTDSWYCLGLVELIENRLEMAVIAFEKVLEQDPGSIDARLNLSVALRKIGRLQDALAEGQKIVNADPKNVAAQNNIGITETELGHLANAKIAFQTALGIAPDYGDAHYNLGNVYLAEGDNKTAAECYQQALDLDAGNVPAILHLALCRQKQKAYDAALALLNPLIVKAQDNVQALGGRANIYRDLGQFEAALNDIDAGLRLAPDDLALLGNKALTLQHAGELDAAIATYRKALKSHPENEPLQTNLAQALLLGGQFKAGWQEFESRLQTPAVLAKRARFSGAPWQGESLAGQHLLLWCEQGLGDSLQFIRYLTEITAAQITLVCPDRLTRLLRSFKTTATIIGESEDLPEADFNAPLMSLPHLLGHKEILAGGAYLSAEAELVSHWQEKLGKRERPRIGIAWQGNPSYEADHQRSLSLKLLEPLLAMAEYQFISLQQGFGQEQLADIEGEIVEWGSEVDEVAGFIDSAAIIANLDLLITSDTALPHLAGALGAPVWLLLPETPDWRWQLNRADSPWYPTMRLFRQSTANDWRSVIDQVAAALAKETFRL